MKNKIKYRLLFYFIGSLLAFSIIIGLAFYLFSNQYNTNVYTSLLEDRAIQIAEELSVFWSDMEYQSRGNTTSSNTDYLGYIRFIRDIATNDIWVLDNNYKLILTGRGQESSSYKELSFNITSIAEEAIGGKTITVENSNSVFNVPTVTVASPIKLKNGTVAGVVIIHGETKDISKTVDNSLIILLSSFILSIIISFFIVNALEKHFTGPLSKMKTAAQKISEGEYTIKVDVSQKDEIGQLASALNDMAEKLNIASRESAKLEKLRQDYVANISHELRTPVTVIRGSLEAICDGVVSDPQMVDEYQRQMLMESIHLERLVSDLLELSRLQNPDFIIEMSLVNLKEIAEDAMHSIKRVADEKKVDIRFSCSYANFIVSGDYGRLRQVLLIFLDNAVKFSPKGSVVNVSLSSIQNTIALSVIDEGPGIAGEDLPHIFERFYKQGSEENKKGTGLGLSIAKEIADRHNAAVTAKNRHRIGCEFSLIMNSVEEKDLACENYSSS